ncbi:uncharacterized protein LOC104936591 isoform X3 [Larimichthys crocea]|uniref:Uncharacterized protein n=1 Tax=Larimichthys crocea TaxID=215358 RepID=A0ACD3RW63_LARCR|nr:uncharacterized protein LOC104936591 isoform X3 [Larimichthys crocea]TMS23887.1 hypothetical protein E3U43_009193 [Larimichthys crocea]
MLDPDLVVCTSAGLKGSISALIPKVDNKKPPMLPPPLPPKRHQRSPASSQLKPFNIVNTPLNSLACHTSPALGGVKRNSQGMDFVPGEVPDMHNEKMRDEENKQEQDLTESNEKIEENEETSRIESQLDMSKPQQQILVIFTDKNNDGEKGEDRMKGESVNIRLTTPTVGENVSLLAMECSDLIPDVDPDMAPTNRSDTATVSAKPDSTISPQPPPKPHCKSPPNPTVTHPQLNDTMRTGTEEKMERTQDDEQWRGKDLVDKERDEKEGEGKDREKVNGHTQTTQTMTETALQLREMSNVRSSVNQDSPLIQEVLAQVKPIGTDSNTETFKGTEIQMFGQGVQDSEVISKLPSGHLEGTAVVETKLDLCQLQLERLEDTHEVAETLLVGQMKQINRKTNARGKVKQLAKKVIDRLKEGSWEKRRMKQMDGVREDDIKLTQDQRGHSKEGGRMKDEVAEDQPAETETESLGDLMECRIKRRNATSGSPFGSFRACSPVKLVEELLSGDEWSQFLYGDQSSDYDPCPCQTHCEDTGELSVDLQFNSSAELDLPVDVFEGSPAVQEEPIYEDIDRSTDTNPMTPRTKDIYDTVEFIQPVQPANTYLNFSDIKSHRVLDCAVQKYLIKLNKKRKHRTAWKDNRTHTGGHSSSTTSPQQVFPASIFYNIPALGGEEQLSAVKCEGNSLKRRFC